jgi:cytochrome c-type biogenesis protein
MSVGLFTAFVAGVVSFLSPCVLPLIPGYVSYVTGHSVDAGHTRFGVRLSSLVLGLYFVLGFSVVFVAFGATATAISRLLLSYKVEANIVGGLLVSLFGLFMIGLVSLPWMRLDARFRGPSRGGRPWGAFLLGLAFGFGWTPCIGPVLGGILTMAAVAETAPSGVLLLAVYAAGLGVPFLLSAMFIDVFVRRRLGKMARLGRTLQVGAGVVMTIFGILMVTGTMSIMSYWLLENVPLLAQIG